MKINKDKFLFQVIPYYAIFFLELGKLQIVIVFVGHRKEGRIIMKYIYDSQGNAVGFINGRYIHSIHGEAIGQIDGTHVHQLAGSYVGELDYDMVVDKHMGNLGNIGHPGNPGNPGSPGNPGNRGSVNYGYHDVFYKLLE